MFAHGQIAMQIFLVDAPKRAQEIARGCPQPFDRVGMHLADAIAIVIACPFLLAMTHGVMDTIDAVVALPFIRITGGVFLGVAVPMFLQRLPIGMLAHAQAALSTVPADGPDYGWTIIRIGPMASAFVRAAARWIARVTVFIPFFPPRSETSHRFLSRRLVTPAGLTSYTR